MPLIAPPILADWVSLIFQGAGAPERTARLVADSLVASDLAGHTSHGVVRVRQYLDAIAAGSIQPDAEPVIAHETASVTLVDGQHGFGQVAADFAMRQTIPKAHSQGIAATGLQNANHVGRLGEWVQLAADQGLIGLAFCNGGARGGAVAPYGGAARRLGTNPIAAAIPVAGQPPLVIDFATSAVAEGKLRVARNRGQTVPEGWILDSDGHPSTNPADFYTGGVLLPAAGHKGYGLSLLVEFLGGMLTGSGWPGMEGFRGDNGVLFVAFAAGVFRPAEAFLADAAALCERVKTTPLAAGFDEVLLPGEPEQRAAERQRATGLLVDEVTWAQLAAAGAGFGVAAPAGD